MLILTIQYQVSYRRGKVTQSAIKNNKNMSLIKCRRNHRGVKLKFQGNHKNDQVIKFSPWRSKRILVTTKTASGERGWRQKRNFKWKGEGIDDL